MSSTWTGKTASRWVGMGSDDTVLVVTPSAPLLNGYTYRVTTVRTDPNNRVECDLGLSPNPLVADYTYTFCVGTETPADIDASGTVDVFDFAIFSSNFDSSGCFIPGDMDGNNAVDVFDFAILAPQFELTDLGSCGGGMAAASSSGAGGAMEALVQSLGYDGVADSCRWLETLSKKDQIAEIAALFELSRQAAE